MNLDLKQIAALIALAVAIPTVSGLAGPPDSLSVLESATARHLTASVGETVTLSFQGPETTEAAERNPFTEYRLSVRFRLADSEPEQSISVQGFYAADGDAAHTGASAGNVWQCRFSPPAKGVWNYEASLRSGRDIAISDESDAGRTLPLRNNRGSLVVSDWPQADERSTRDLRRLSRLTTDGHYYRHAGGKYRIKAGANSPENLLAFADFDGTYRLEGKQRSGEAATSASVHRYLPHVRDHRAGDPTWRNGKGKGLIGAINYLSSTGMNSVYFLTLNIGGDGRDVWPYANPRDLARFDCSKLDQWEIVFEHMQRKGLQLHLVTQETENERLLDDGDTGRLRKLYYRELIARFSHHPALVWNLGEENGPAAFSPHGQSPEQQKAMAGYIDAHDPYDHPIVIHTHHSDHDQERTLQPLLGHPSIDGLSLQVGRPERVPRRLARWRDASKGAGHPWVVSIDEIGHAGTGAKPDADDPNHDVIRDHVLWGGLMSGAGGVEWYFGFKYSHSDLGCEDWRSRDLLWKQTKIALDVFNSIPFWEMRSADEMLTETNGYCFAKPGHVYAVYRSAGQGVSAVTVKVAGAERSRGRSFRVTWVNPRTGRRTSGGFVEAKEGVIAVELPQSLRKKGDLDWVFLSQSQQ